MLPSIVWADDESTKADAQELFAVASLSTGEKDVYLGDSVIVTVTLYAVNSFSSIKNKSDKVPSIKRSTVHRYNAGRQLRQGVANYNRRQYYAVAAEQFAITPSETGEYTFPAQKYDVELLIEKKKQYYDPFEDFFSFGSPFRQRATEKVKKTCASEPIKIKVSKRPPKTIDELRRSGTMVM